MLGIIDIIIILGYSKKQNIGKQKERKINLSKIDMRSFCCIIKMLKVSPICTGEYKHDFTAVNRAYESDVSWTTTCISQSKKKTLFRFDFL